jgi:hypothetical protein
MDRETPRLFSHTSTLSTTTVLVRMIATVPTVPRRPQEPQEPRFTLTTDYATPTGSGSS